MVKIQASKSLKIGCIDNVCDVYPGIRTKVWIYKLKGMITCKKRSDIHDFKENLANTQLDIRRSTFFCIYDLPRKWAKTQTSSGNLHK